MEYAITWKIYLIGLAILVGAIIINYVGNLTGLNSWYDVFFKQTKDISIINWIFLLFIYPLLLGLIGYFATKLLI